MKDFKTTLLEGERLDEIGFNGLRLIQKPEEFCYGVDAVILADFAAYAKNAKRIIDLGTGTGIIPLILSYKTQALEIFGIEMQKASLERGLRNIALNQLTERIKLLQGDVTMLSGTEAKDPGLHEITDAFGTFDVVVTNPPYIMGNCGLTNESSAKAAARHETTAGLEVFIKAGAELLRHKGDFFMVHRPSRLVDICVECRKHRLEPKELRFVSASKSSKPNIILIHCVKYGGAELKMLDPLYIYDENGDYTEEINRIYER